LSKLANDPSSLLIAVDNNGNIVGFAFSHFNTVYLDWFGVDPKARGNGIGKLLSEDTFETSKKRGAHKI
jgi:ribosomal protein S18 acetylase RimI-like enzyme